MRALARGIAPCLIASLVLASCTQANGSADQRRSAHSAPTFVSLNPCTDAILLEVADPQQVLAISHFSHDPRASSLSLGEARKYKSTGGTVEEIVVLNPDIVLAGKFLAPAKSQALESLKFRLELFGSTDKIEQSFEQIRSIGALAGHSERAEKLIEDIGRSLAASVPDPQEAQISAVLWQPGQIVPGKKTLISQLMARTGFASHSQLRGLGQADYLPLENVLADPPEVLLIAGDERAQHHPALGRLKDIRIEYFDPSLLYCGGPTIIRAAERLAIIRRSVR